MTKPQRLRVRLHEMNRPPEYLHAYPADEMDEYTAGIEEENAELQALFDLQWKRMRLAEKLWCDAHPDRKNVRPDLGALIQWFMDERDRIMADYVQALSLLDGAEDVVELYGCRAEYPSGTQWAKDWLMKARGLFASYQKTKEARNGK